MADEHTTIIETGRGGSGAGWFIAAILVVALIAGIYFFTRTSSSDAARNDAIANAASQVGDAAQKAGNAAQDAANNAAK